MNDTPSARPDDSRPQVFDFQKLDCYQAALRLQGLLPELGQRCGYSLREQLERAAASILLNTAEACGRRALRDRARFFGMARGSAMECAAIVDIVAARQSASLVSCRQAHTLLVRIVSMLTKLEQRHRALRSSASEGRARARLTST